MTYTDVFGIKHDNCKVISNPEEFKRIVIISDEFDRHFTCVRTNAPLNEKTTDHWRPSKPQNAPIDYMDKPQK